MDDQAAQGIFALVFGSFQLVYFAIAIITLVGMWKIFEKAGKPGWAAIIPIYNIIVLLEIVGRPLWWVALMFVPIAQLVVAVILAIDLAKAFGKDVGFAIGMILLPFVFYPMLGFGSAQYVLGGGGPTPPAVDAAA